MELLSRELSFVHVAANTTSGKRLYRMAISNNLTTLKPDFEIFGLLGDCWEFFQKGEDYDVFLIKKKKL